jgi:hypothetical protein
MLLVGHCEAFDAVGDIDRSRFGGGKEAGALILFTVGHFCRAVGAVGIVSSLRTVGSICTVCGWQVNVGVVEWLVEILYLKTVKDGEDTTLCVEVIVY